MSKLRIPSDWGWHEEWGTFADHGTEMSAPQACCACGGGSSTNFKANPGAQGLKRSPPQEQGTASSSSSPSSGVRKTWNGCACKKTWSEGGLSCSNYCCNPDDDEFGNWCFVEDEQCEEAAWGYCEPVGGNAEHRDCTDLQGWADTEGDGCGSYAEQGWCNADGTPGTGWDGEWGNFVDFFSQGHSALTACCVCGGGNRNSGAARNACSDVPSWKDPDGDGCAEYANFKWCTSTGSFGVGWHEEWGNFGGTPTAAKACCYCGGGAGGTGRSEVLTAVRPGKVSQPASSSSSGFLGGMIAAVLALVLACSLGLYFFKTKKANSSGTPGVRASRIGQRYGEVDDEEQGLKS